MMEQFNRPLDYVDSLEPGYRFCPSDSELIVYYLKPMIETGNHPPCRLFQVDLYAHTPQQLSRQHRACDDKWYFLTSRERKYSRGNRPNRRTGDFGYWKTTQKDVTVYDEVTREAVGKKRSLAYYDQNDLKTPWLMHEYTTNNPDLPIGSGQQGNTIYKRETGRSANNSNDHSAEQQQVVVVNNTTRRRNRDDDEEEMNLLAQSHDEPAASPARRPRLSVNHAGMNHEPPPQYINNIVQILEEPNHYHNNNNINVHDDDQLVMITEQPMAAAATFQASTHYDEDRLLHMINAPVTSNNHDEDRTLNFDTSECIYYEDFWG